MPFQNIRCTLVGFALLATLSLAACSGDGLGRQSVAGQTPSGSVELTAVQVAYIGSGKTGSGTLFFNGHSYDFTLGGAGIGGIGVSTIDGVGEVYNLSDISQFPGTYAQARIGFALGTVSAGELWMQNAAGVILHVKARRTGLMLSLGGDALLISLSN